MKTAAEKPGTHFTPDPLQDGQLLHYLFSPLELKAFDGAHDPIASCGRGYHPAIPDHINQELAKIGLHKLRLFTGFISGLTHAYIKSDPVLETFLYRPLIEHRLSTRLYHLLQAKACHNMEDMIRLGMPGIRSMRGIGKGSVNALQKLLEKNGCSGLL